MENLIKINKDAWKTCVEISTKETVKELSAMAQERLDANTKDVFSGVTLSKELKDYCKTLLVAQLVAKLNKDFRDINKAPYLARKDLAIEEKTEITRYFSSVAKIATNGIKREVKALEKDVDKNLDYHIAYSDFIIMETDFSSVSKELKLIINGCAKNIAEFNKLVLIIYAKKLSKKMNKRIKDTVMAEYAVIMGEYCFDSFDAIPNNRYEELVEKGGKKPNSERLLEQVLGLEGKAYLIKPEALIRVEASK